MRTETITDRHFLVREQWHTCNLCTRRFKPGQMASYVLGVEADFHTDCLVDHLSKVQVLEPIRVFDPEVAFRNLRNDMVTTGKAFPNG